MDLIRDSAFFTTLLHCVLAHSLPQIDYLAQNPGSYDNVSPIPGSGILQTPYDKLPELGTQTLMVNPSWNNRPFLDNVGLVHNDEVKNSQPHSYKPERPGTTLKGIGLKYPLTIPRVKLSFTGHSGMLPVKNIQNTPAPKADPPSKVLKPTSSELSTKPNDSERLVGRVPLRKNITPSKLEILEQAGKLDLKSAKRYPPISTSSLYNQELPSDDFQYIPSSKLELPGLVLNPTNFGYLPTKPNIVYGNNEAVKSVPYPAIYDHTGIESLKPNFKYPTNLGGYGIGFSAEKAVKYTPSYKTYVPETAVPKLTDPDYSHKKGQDPLDGIQHTSPYKANLSVEALKATNLDYFPAQPVGRDEKATAIKLPPVPTTMPLLRRIQLVLMNTVAGLPGGNQQVLDSLRAR